MKRIIAFAGIVLALSSGFAIGHSGGTDANGCHTDHKTNDYHCHNPPKK